MLAEQRLPLAERGSHADSAARGDTCSRAEIPAGLTPVLRATGTSCVTLRERCGDLSQRECLRSADLQTGRTSSMHEPAGICYVDRAGCLVGGGVTRVVISIGVHRCVTFSSFVRRYSVHL